MFKRLGTILLRTGSDHSDGINLRKWFIFYALYLMVLAGMALISFGYYEADEGQVAQKIWLLALYLFYMSLCCTFFPAPTAWLVLLMASPVIELVNGDFLMRYLAVSAQDVSWVAVTVTIIAVGAIGAMGTSMANLNEYHIFTFFLRFGKVGRIRQTRLYEIARRWFAVSPFGLMVLFNFIPVPVDMVRWLAISHRYGRGRYCGAIFTGRFLRYAMLAGAATSLKLSLIQISIIQLTLIVLVLISFVFRLMARRKQNVMPEVA